MCILTVIFFFSTASIAIMTIAQSSGKPPELGIYLECIMVILKRNVYLHKVALHISTSTNFFYPRLYAFKLVYIVNLRLRHYGKTIVTYSTAICLALIRVSIETDEGILSIAA